MFGKKKPAVLIVGAGPVGLFAAIVLTRHGIPVRIVDKQWRCGARSDALALHAETLELLAGVGLLEPVLERALRVETIGLYDGISRRAETRLDGPDQASACVAVVPQNVLEHIFEDALRGLGVKVCWSHEVSRLVPGDRGSAVTIDKLCHESRGYAISHMEWVVERSTQLEAPFVIGADGHRSCVRRALKIEFPAVGPGRHFAMFEFQSNTDLKNELRIVIDDHTTNSVWPLPNGSCRWTFELRDISVPRAPASKDRLAVCLDRAYYSLLSDDGLSALLSCRAPWFDGDIGEIHWRIIVPFERRLAKAFGKGRVWLAGDAVHVTGPVGIQSMNVGLSEAYDLAQIVAQILHGRESDKALADYNRRRVAVWQHLLAPPGRHDTADAAAARIADRCHRLTACLPASGDRLASLTQKLNLTPV